MPLTTLDERTAVVIIDLQRGIEALLGREAMAATVSHAARLARAFRSRKLPVILVRVDFSADGMDRPRNRVTVQRPFRTPPPNWAEILDELEPASTDIIVTKRQPGAFYGTDLDLHLRRRAITNIVIGGVITSLGVESTARAAYDHGYNITFASDAMMDRSPAVHEHCLGTIFPMLGEVDTTERIFAALAR